MKTSPSRLVYVEACPKFQPSPLPNDAADDGIRLHAAMEHLVERPLPEWDDYINGLDESTSSKAALLTAAEQIRPYIEPTLGPRLHVGPSLSLNKHSEIPCSGVYPEVEVELGHNRRGYIDLLIVNRTEDELHLTIVDYKFVRFIGDYELQLAAYAVAVNDLLASPDGPTVYVDSVIVAPYVPGSDQMDTLRWAYTEESIGRYRKIIQDIDESVTDPNRDGNPGPQCEHCKYCGKCRYQVGISVTTMAATNVADALPVVPVGGSAKDIIERFMNPKTLEDRAQRKMFVKAVEHLVDFFVEDDKTFFDENPDAELPGFRKTRMPGRRTLDKNRASEINMALLSQLGGTITATDLLEASVPLVDKLAERLSFTQNISADEAKRRINNVLDDFMTKGADYFVFRKAAQKARVPKPLPESVL